jgi:hypothetical protein
MMKIGTGFFDVLFDQDKLIDESSSIREKRQIENGSG